MEDQAEYKVTYFQTTSEPTNNLRWYEKKGKKVLQQYYRITDFTEKDVIISGEWRELSVVKEIEI